MDKLVFFFFFLISFRKVAGDVPAMYVLGDSLADVGNNNHLALSVLKANFEHNGIDFLGGKATGRFSNGKNSADLLAAGLSFASGGAGIQDSTHAGQCLTFNNQIDDLSNMYGSVVQLMGSAAAQAHLSKSIFAISIGSNDILVFMRSGSSLTYQEFVDSLVISLQDQLKRLYNLGAHKIIILGAGPIGCIPRQRVESSTGDCIADTNTVSALQQMQAQLPDLSYSFVDVYSALLQYIQNPDSYGFTEAKAACCGLGTLNAKVACTPVSTYCSNRDDHVFWDMVHPTQRTADLLTSVAMDGSAPFVFPINGNQLSAL